MNLLQQNHSKHLSDYFEQFVGYDLNQLLEYHEEYEEDYLVESSTKTSKFTQKSFK